MIIVRFTKHAKIRSKERGIPNRLIRRVLNNPDKIEHIEENKFIYYGEYKDKIIKIIVLKKKEIFKVITLYYENYLR